MGVFYPVVMGSCCSLDATPQSYGSRDINAERRPLIQNATPVQGRPPPEKTGTIDLPRQPNQIIVEDERKKEEQEEIEYRRVENEVAEKKRQQELQMQARDAERRQKEQQIAASAAAALRRRQEEALAVNQKQVENDAPVPKKEETNIIHVMDVKESQPRQLQNNKEQQAKEQEDILLKKKALQQEEEARKQKEEQKKREEQTAREKKRQQELAELKKKEKIDVEPLEKPNEPEALKQEEPISIESTSDVKSEPVIETQAEAETAVELTSASLDCLPRQRKSSLVHMTATRPMANPNRRRKTGMKRKTTAFDPKLLENYKQKIAEESPKVAEPVPEVEAHEEEKNDSEPKEDAPVEAELDPEELERQKQEALRKKLGIGGPGAPLMGFPMMGGDVASLRSSLKKSERPKSVMLPATAGTDFRAGYVL